MKGSKVLGTGKETIIRESESNGRGKVRGRGGRANRLKRRGILRRVRLLGVMITKYISNRTRLRERILRRRTNLKGMWGRREGPVS